MIYLGIIPGPKPRLYLLAVTCSALAIGAYALFPGQSFHFKMLAEPEAVAYSQWDDAYNSVLIRKLLSKTPLLGGIRLTKEDMMEYGTGQWYFDTDTFFRLFRKVRSVSSSIHCCWALFSPHTGMTGSWMPANTRPDRPPSDG